MRGATLLSDRQPEPAKVVAVVMNGSAGALLDRPDGREMIEAAFAAVGLQPHFVGHDVGTLPERLQFAAASAAAAVVVAGGDGTVACAAQALAGSSMPLGVLPFGTMNLLARDLGIPVGDVAAAVQVLASGHERAIDAADVNGHVFLCASMLGVPARMGRLREQTRGAGSALGRMRRMARAFFRFSGRARQLRLHMRLGRDAVRVRAASVTIVVNALDEGAGAAFKRVRPDGGDLVAYVVPAMTPGRLVVLAARLLRGRWRNTASVQEHRGPNIVIRARGPAVRVMNDGETRLLRPPLNYRVRPGALRIIVPAP